MIDLAIIGAGPAGLTAAIYAARAGLSFVILDQDGCGGGQISAAHEVENYPGLGRLSGTELGSVFLSHAEMLGAQVCFAVVRGLEDHGEFKEILIEDKEPLQARAVIAATGAVPRSLGVPGEELTGVSCCAICDGAFYKDKNVLVVGGGDTAVEDALYLSSICRTVTVALRRDTFRAAKSRVDVLKETENVTILYYTRLTGIQGRGRVASVVLEGPNGQTERPMDGVFIAVGVSPVSEWLNNLPLERSEEGYILAGEDCATNIPGLFVAGDLRRKPLRQVVTTAADGANAVFSTTVWLKDF